MKKLLFLMMALMVAPAMADVVFSVVNNADKTADIMVEFTGADTVDGNGQKSRIAGIGLNVSVSSGNIVAVTGYKAETYDPNSPTVDPPQSTEASPGYGIHMGTMSFTGGPPSEVDNGGTPQAPFDSPTGPLIILPASAIVLEHGALFDVGVPADAPLAGLQTLCTIEVSEQATLTITGGNSTRGGVVRIGGGVPTTIDYGTGVVVTGFAVTEYNVTVTVNGNGNVGNAPGNPYPSGNTATLTPNADANHHFDGWSGTNAGELAGPFSGDYTLLMDGDKAVTATFVIDQYTLTYNDDGNGSIVGTTPQTVNHGSSGSTVTADPDTNYYFVDWTPGGLTNPIRTDTNVTGNITVTANFAKIQHTLTITLAGTGTGVIEAPYSVGGQQVDQGTTVVVVGTPDGGSSLVSIIPNDFEMTGAEEVIVTFDLLECIKSDSPMYADWVLFGKPDCWCYETQCRGDANGEGEFTNAVRVFSADLAIFLSAYGQPTANIDAAKACADFNHTGEFTNAVRVFSLDLAIFMANYGKPTAQIVPCPLDWDGVGGDDYNFFLPMPQPLP